MKRIAVINKKLEKNEGILKNDSMLPASQQKKKRMRDYEETKRQEAKNNKSFAQEQTFWAKSMSLFTSI